MQATSGAVQEPRGADATTPGQELDLRVVLQALQRRRRLALAVLAGSLMLGALATAWQRIHQPVFQGGFKMLVTDPINQDDRKENQGDASLEAVALAGRGTTADTGALIQVLSSPLLLTPVETKLGIPSGSLDSALSVGTSRPQRNLTAMTSGVLEVRLQWPDPVQGTKILEQLSREYLAYSLRQRQEKLNQGLSFLDQQAPDLQRRVNVLQSQLADFRRRHGFIAPEQQAEAIMQQRAALGNQLDTLQQEQARIQGRITAVRQGELGSSHESSAGSKGLASGAQAVTASTSSSDSSIQQLNDVENALAEAEANYTDSAPQVLELRAKRNRLRPLIQSRQISQLQGALIENQAQQKAIDQQLSRLSDSFISNPQLIKQYEGMQQQLVVARDNLSSYIKARENFRLQVAQRTVPWSLLAPATFSSKPFKPNLARNLFLSIVFGSLGGIALALLRDRLDHVFHDPLELKTVLALPLLGIVPYFDWSNENTITQAINDLDTGKKFEIRESLRNLYANFRLLRADKTLRLVALTSSTQGEGKSSTSVLFAKTLSQLGQRVLLVDADMRRPMLHRYLGVDNGNGLSSLLTSTDISVAETIQSVDTNLDLISAGPLPPDTTQLLSSERCRHVVDQIRLLTDYDLIVFDTPPAYLLSDPVLLSEHLDGLLFVVGIDCVSRDLPGQAIERIRETGVDVLGVLASHPINERARKDGYGYNYFIYGYSGYRQMVGRYIDNQLGNGRNQTENSSPYSNVQQSEGKPSRKSTTQHASPLNKIHRLFTWLDRRG